jgi:hypothetical protein
MGVGREEWRVGRQQRFPLSAEVGNWRTAAGNEIATKGIGVDLAKREL